MRTNTTTTPRTNARLRLSSVEPTRLCSVIHVAGHAKETKQWLSEDNYRQKCEVKARRDAKKCRRILTALGAKRVENLE